MEWTGDCERWAHAGEQFEVHKVEVQHFRFCHQFCVVHNYHYRFQNQALGLVAIFTPPKSLTIEVFRS